MSHQLISRSFRAHFAPSTDRPVNIADECVTAYRVNYYVAVRANGEDTEGCLLFVEPNPERASPRAPHMAMTICDAPIEVSLCSLMPPVEGGAQ